MAIEKVSSVQIDGIDLCLIESVHLPSPGGVGYVGEGKSITDVGNRWDGWIDAIVSVDHEDQIYGWLVKETVNMLIRTVVNIRRYLEFLYNLHNLRNHNNAQAS